MAGTAGIIQRNLGQGYRAIFVELADLGGINGDHVGADITGKCSRIPFGTAHELGHVALNTFDGQAFVNFVVLVFFLFEVAIFAQGTGRLFTRFLELHHARVGVVAQNAVNDRMFALEQLFVLFVMLDEAVGGVDLSKVTPDMTLSARGRVPVYLHAIGHGVVGV